MVLYFSATGNTEHVAKTLARLLEDESLNLLERIQQHDYSEITSSKAFVICAPTYVCEMPRFLADYLKKVKLSGNRNVYFIFTSGGYSGIGGILAEKIFKKKGMVFHGYTELKMPRNYIASDMYSELTDDEIRSCIREADDKIIGIADTIKGGGRITNRHVFLWELIVTMPFNPVWCRINQPVKPFSVSDKCISCKKCVRLCPLNVIHMEGGRPKWEGSRCAHCMSCIQNCPAEAIDFGEITQKKRRYLFKKYER
ncbi:MAG: EFR1 family ferrodoxin [Butyrivibrio sp.]|nr:EFR1 family ferrodoxin [Butyrivibrio sp.]